MLTFIIALALQQTPPQATAADKIAVKQGFKIELLYSVPKAKEGSWVGLCADPKGRIIVSDQGGLGLFRYDPKSGAVEKIDVPVSGAQGLLWAFDALYAVVNGKGSGLWRITDSNGDDRLDKAEHLIPLQGGGEHGPHAAVLTEDGKGLYFMGGNHTTIPPDLTGSRVPMNWDEDHLLPRNWDGNGHARGILAPGGWVCRTSPDGKERVLISTGYRNQYDLALNRHGEAFTFDADMEWDLGMPWYRPTRVCHIVSGSEFGWRSGTGKWPTYYPDSLPAVVDIGPASPTGVVMGTGAKFPAKYQDALYILDWTYGTIWACHLKPAGASYTADVEEFVSATPLPVTDAAVAADGALYFAVGGRGAQSGLYRVTYVGSESTAPPSNVDDAGAAARAQRRALEVYHGRKDPKAVEAAWPLLGSPDRFLRYAARIAVESQPAAEWTAKALALTEPQALVTAMVALARQGKAADGPAALKALGRLDLAKLPQALALEALRALQLCCIRLGRPLGTDRDALLGKLSPLFPAASDELNAELVQLLVYLQDPTAVTRTMKLFDRAKPATRPAWLTVLDRNKGYAGAVDKAFGKSPPLEKIHYAFVLRNATIGWTPELRKTYFEFLRHIETQYSGGASYPKFVQQIRKDAVASLTAAERNALGAELTGDKPKPAIKLESLPAPKGPGREWTMADALALVEGGLKKRDFENGKRAFRAARCIACHRFDAEGGDQAPDLTGVAARFGVRDLLEAILEPSKVISDQYQATMLRTKDGSVVAGRVVGEKDGKLQVVADLLYPEKLTEISKDQIAESKPSTLSPMPEKLVSPLNENELLDLLAYLLAAGDSKHRLFR
jgi:putative heme-binding domain-containing protein